MMDAKRNNETAAAGLERNLGYAFRSKELLETALTHISYHNGNREKGTMNNERLEFLGDAWLDAVIGEELFRRLPDMPEGKLTRLRADIVCERSLHEIACSLGIGEALLLSAGEEKDGGRKKPSILADAVEAVLAAVYLDGGFDAVRGLILRLFDDKIAGAVSGREIADCKTALQELLQKNGPADIVYTDVRETGPDHNKTFTVSVSNFGKRLGTGTGHSKKEAEQNAAREALKNAAPAE